MEMALPAGIICAAKDYERSLKGHSMYCLRRNDTIGVVVSPPMICLLLVPY